MLLSCNDVVIYLSVDSLLCNDSNVNMCSEYSFTVTMTKSFMALINETPTTVIVLLISSPLGGGEEC